MLLIDPFIMTLSESKRDVDIFEQSSVNLLNTNGSFKFRGNIKPNVVIESLYDNWLTPVNW